MPTDPTERFSSRVENYIKYRPNYPQAVIDCLRDRCGLSSKSAVADVGSGTGIFSQLLTSTAAQVYGVEPNRDMRDAAVRLLRGQSNFISVDGTSEATTLPDHSVDIVTAAQAFHWFDRVAARREFVRILKPGGWVMLIWNDRRTDSTPFLRDYERLLQTYADDYTQVNHREISDDIIAAFYAPGTFTAMRAFIACKSQCKRGPFTSQNGTHLSGREKKQQPEMGPPEHKGEANNSQIGTHLLKTNLVRGGGILMRPARRGANGMPVF